MMPPRLFEPADMASWRKTSFSMNGRICAMFSFS
jgi:hypothetical protein